MRQPDRAVVLITHDMDLAAALCDRLAVMLNCRIARLDSLEVIFRRRKTCCGQRVSHHRQCRCSRIGSTAMRETNFLRRLNPLTKLALAVAYIVTASLVFDPIFQLSVIAATLMLTHLIIERIGPLELAKVMSRPLPSSASGISG